MHAGLIDSIYVYKGSLSVAMYFQTISHKGWVKNSRLYLMICKVQCVNYWTIYTTILLLVKNVETRHTQNLG